MTITHRSFGAPARRPRSLIVLALLLAALAGCSGLGGEPRIVATIAPETVARQQVASLVSAPDVGAGAAIFAANCTRCHGISGAGDGEMVRTGQLTTTPPDFTDPDNVRSQSPADWFEVVTNGRLEQLMPPWRDSLSAMDRWHVTLYSYALQYTPDELARGAVLWETDCAQCHGADGRGVEHAESIAEPATLALASDRDLQAVLLPADGTDPHAFAEDMSDEDRWAAVAFTRTLGLRNADQLGRSAIVQAATPAAPMATPEVTSIDASVPPSPGANVSAASTAEATTIPAPEATDSAVTGSFRGEVSQGTASGAAPAGITVTLRALDRQFNETTYETTTAEDGSFAFTDIPIDAERRYVASADYNGNTFASDIVRGDPAAPDTTLSITVYDATADPSVIRISDMLTQVFPEQNVLQVAQIVRFSNTSDRMFITDEAVDDVRRASVRVALPPGAALMDFADNRNRYALSPNGASIVDTIPVLPGDTHVVHVLYSLPMDGDVTFEQVLDYALGGQVQVLTSPPLVVESAQLQPQEPVAMGQNEFQAWGGTPALQAGDVLRFTVRAQAPGVQLPALDASSISVALIIVGAVAILAALVLTLYSRRAPATTRATGDPALVDALVAQIAELDAAHKAGEISQSTYEVRRKKLKARLAELLDSEG